MDGKHYYNDLLGDEFFQPFFDEDANVTKLTTSALQSGSDIATVLAKLNEGVFLLNKDLHSQVAADHDSLLSQATGIETLENVLQMMQTRLKALTVAVDRIGDCVAEPYKALHTRMKQLERIQQTCDLLRRIQRITTISTKLKALQGNKDQMIKAAQCLNELNYLISGFDWEGIDVLRDECIMIKETEAKFKSMAKNTLLNGVESDSTAFIGNSLQILHHLNCLQEAVEEYLDTIDSLIKKKLTSAVTLASMRAGPGGKDLSRPQSGTVPGTSAALLATLWNNLDSFLLNVYKYTEQVFHMQKSLDKRKDLLSGSMHHVATDTSSWEERVMKDFWTRFCQHVESSLSVAVKKSTFLKETFINSFPKLLRKLNAFYNRVESIPGIENIPGLTFTNPGKEQLEANASAYGMLRKTVCQFEQAYLANSLAILFDSVKLLFHQSSIRDDMSSTPQPAEVDKLNSIIDKHLEAVSFDPKLSLSMASNVAKSVELYCNQCEPTVSFESDASQLMMPPSEGQRRNANIVNNVYTLKLMMLKIVNNDGPDGTFSEKFPSAGVDRIIESIKTVDQLLVTALQPLFTAVFNALAAIVGTMHDENYTIRENRGQGSSQNMHYMQELQTLCQRLLAEYFSLFACSPFVSERFQDVVAQFIDLLVIHASLVRPINMAGRSRMAEDLGQIEAFLIPLCSGDHGINKTFRLLRMVKTLLLLADDEAVMESTAAGVIPCSTVLLFMFGRGPTELKSPHNFLGIGIPEMVAWMREHPTEKERLSMIGGALDVYAKMVSARGSLEYAPVYPIMRKMLNKGLSPH